MAEKALRGSGIGFQSLESEEGVEFAERFEVVYDCPSGHTTVLPFAVEAEVPAVWQCRCGLISLLRDSENPEFPKSKNLRTHWDMLMERRTLDQLEELLQERLDLLRNRRSSPMAAVQ
jgi:hypothetical protein